MGIGSVSDPFCGNDGLVDHMIGDAYRNVKKVAYALDNINIIATNIDNITEVLDSIDDIASLSGIRDHIDLALITSNNNVTATTSNALSARNDAIIAQNSASTAVSASVSAQGSATQAALAALAATATIVRVRFANIPTGLANGTIIFVALDETHANQQAVYEVVAGTVTFRGVLTTGVAMVSSFNEIATLNIPANTFMIQTSGYYAGSIPPPSGNFGSREAKFAGGARYVYDSLVDAAYVTAHPLTSVMNGTRGFRLAEPIWDMFMLGAKADIPDDNTILTNNSRAAQAAADVGAHLHVSSRFYMNPDMPLIMLKNSSGSVWTLTGDGERVSELSWQTNNTHKKPMMGIPEGYVALDANLKDTMYNWDGTLRAANPSTGGGTLRIDGLALNAGYGRFSTLMCTCNLISSVFRNINVISAFRGLFNAQTFDVIYDNVHTTGRFYFANTTYAMVNELYKLSFGLFCPGQATINQFSANQCGTGIVVNQNANITGARVEVCEQGYLFGGPAYLWDSWNGTDFTEGRRPWVGTAYGLQSESCYRACDIEGSARGRIMCAGFTAFDTEGVVEAGGQSNQRIAKYGLRIHPGVTADLVIENSGTSNAAPVYNYGSPKFVNNTWGDFKGSGNLISSTENDNDIGGSWEQSLVNPAKNKSLTRTNRLSSLDSRAMLQGLSAFDLRKANIFAKTLGGNVKFPAAATSMYYNFVGRISGNEAQFSSAPTAVNVGVALPAGKYFIATTLVAPNGETGVNYDPINETDITDPGTSIAHMRTVTVAAGQGIRLQVANVADSGLIRRFYIGTTRSNWNIGMFEIPGDQLSLTVAGDTAPTAKEVPPTVSSIIPSRIEDNDQYELIVSNAATWNHGGMWVTNKTASGFVLNCVNPAPGGGGSVGFLIARP